MDVLRCDFSTLATANLTSLAFTNQNNWDKGEKIGHVQSGHHSACLVLAIIRLVKHLHSQNALPATALSSYFCTRTNKWCKVLSKDITTNLRQAVTILNPTSLGFELKDIETRSLHSGGAIALLISNVDTDKICLLGHWKSDAMLRYLHI